MSKMIRQHLLEQFQRLDEKLLTSEFTFGFELEAICNDSSICYDIDNIKDYIDEQLTKNVTKEQRNKLGGHSDIHQDSSVRGDYEDNGDDDYSNEEMSFEYGSPIFPCTPYWFNRVITTLRNLINNGFYTNDTCGFHHHLHFNGMTERDMVWIYCNLAMDSETYDKFSSLQGADDREYYLYSNQWARRDAMKDLKAAVNAENWEGVIEQLNTNKWRAFRIHPQGTLEWRGPRDFMNRGNLENINRFYKLFNQLIAKIRKYMDLNVLTDTNITKKEFFQHLTDAVDEMSDKPDMEFISHTEGYDSGTTLKYKTDKRGVITPETINNLIKRFKNNPTLFVNLINDNPDSIDFFLQIITKKNGLYDIMFSVRDKYLTNDSIDFEEKKYFIENLLEELKNYCSSTKLGAFVKDFNLSKYDAKLAVKALREVSSISAFKELLRFVLKESPQNLKIKDLEKAVYSLLTNSVYLDSVLKVLLQRQYVNILGESYIIRILLWALNACVSTGSRIDGYSSMIPITVNKIKNVVKADGSDKNWDLVISQLINNGSDNLLAYMIKKPSRDHIAKWAARNPHLRSELDSDLRDDDTNLY